MATDIVFKTDRFNGVLINTAEQTVAMETFTEQLKDSMNDWIQQGKRGLWVTIGTDHCSIIPQLAQMGLDFHHAKPGYVCMTKWMATSLPNTLPGYANHYVGAGGFVVNSHNQILAIKEQYHVRNNISMWKLPGGTVDAGEELEDAAKREVLEETGVPCEFVCVLGYRHMHGYRHGCSDIYVVCLLRPLSLDIKACPQEIAECKWMDLDEYAASGISDINRYFVDKYRDYLATGTAIGVKDVVSYNKKLHNKVYYACKIVEKADKEAVNGETSKSGVSGQANQQL